MKFPAVLFCMFFVGFCHATFIVNRFDECLQERYSIGAEKTPEKKIGSGDLDVTSIFGTASDLGSMLFKPEVHYLCNCSPSKDKYCIAPYICVKDSTPDDLLDKYKDCGVYATVKTTNNPQQKEPEDGQIGGRCERWRYCYGQARCENYKCVPHACKKEGEIPNGPDDKCCMPMVTHKGEPCKLLNTDHSPSTCNSHRQCQLDHEGRDYVCCYAHGRQNEPSCVRNKDCKTFDLYSEWSS